MCWLGNFLPPMARGEASPLRISGHSLGGSMAMLAAFELSKNYTIKVTLGTFGTGKIGPTNSQESFWPTLPISCAGLIGRVLKSVIHVPWEISTLCEACAVECLNARKSTPLGSPATWLHLWFSGRTSLEQSHGRMN